MVDISIQTIKDFLDACDIVLNSNTFILKFEKSGQSLKQSLSQFLYSESFLLQIKNQDVKRQWFNLHYFDLAKDSFQVKPGPLVKRGIDLHISEPILSKKEYLIGMLTADSKQSYYSFYGTEKSRLEAEAIVDGFLLTLLDDQHWELFSVKPDFLLSSKESYNNEEICYFENDFGNDSAIIISARSKGYLILTNGTP